MQQKEALPIVSTGLGRSGGLVRLGGEGLC